MMNKLDAPSISKSLDWEQRTISVSNDLIKDLLEKLTHPILFDSSNAEGLFILTGNPVRKHFNLNKGTIEQLELPVFNTPPHINNVPFVAGYCGFLSYTAASSPGVIEGNASENEIQNFLGLYTWSLKGQDKKGLLTYSPLCPPALRKLINSVIDSHQETERLNRTNSQSQATLEKADISELYLKTSWSLSTTREHYNAQFAKIQAYLHAGDAYQVNFTQRFETECPLSSLDVYSYLRNITETPFSSYISLGEHFSILSFSPERFIQIKNRHIETSPIKGTAANDGNPETINTLRNSTKNQSENLMIVDLLRNDLNKVCKEHSVKVEKLFALETFNNVHHLISTIKGELKDNISELSALADAFPGGSITGAPKKRAMEIIAETEAHPREVYCGSIFYWNYDGTLDSNILIRTILKKHDKLYCWAGGGITVESLEAEEYAESLQKVSNLTGILPSPI